MNLLKKFIGSSATDEIALIPSGKLFLTRSPNSPKGELECLYNDAFASIRQTTTPFYYQLCIIKAYQEGELDGHGSAGFDDLDNDDDYDDRHHDSATSNEIDGVSHTKDEWSFQILEDLQIYQYNKPNGSRAIRWNDMSGDLGDKFEFVIDEEIKFNEIDGFVFSLYKCLYETKYQRSSLGIKSIDELSEFTYDPKSEFSELDDLKKLQNDKSEETKAKGTKEDPLFVEESDSSDDEINMSGEISSFSWLLAFELADSFNSFEQIFLTSLWQFLNKTKFGVKKEESADKDYIINAMSNLNIDNNKPETEEEAESDSESESESDSEDDEVKLQRAVNASIRDKSDRRRPLNEEDDDYDDFADQREYDRFREKKNETNSGLSVGSSKDRNYVVRGDKLGVFSNDGDELKYQTTISNVRDLNGKSVKPQDLLLHRQDNFMIFKKKSSDEASKLFKMDLNRGKIIEEWSMDEAAADGGVTAYGPTSKLAQLTDEQTLLGTSKNGIFYIDPRESGSKIVNDSTYKQYKTKNNGFSTIATTVNGYVAIGSDKGDIKLFDQVGKNARTALPSLGSEITGLEVSKDGRWLLVTYPTFLTLIDNKIGPGQRNAGSIGFEKYFDLDKKPTPLRLSIRPEHFSYMINETGQDSVKFTKAHFNTGIGSTESTIVTSTGKYVIAWSLNDIIKKKKQPQNSYTVYRYDDPVVADNFRFNSNNDVITATKDDVSMVSKRGFRKASKESLTKKN
ncbi:hypothetical protein QCA50_012912 [Cerrena zonata]|uniref:Uncharacterized protein n=1 Tax=Cerrena zonata TaxID=2478898 RepID=A0AAW0G2T2_9APHY